MHVFYRLLGFLCSVCILPSSLQALPYPYWKAGYQTLPVHPKAHWQELENGLTYCIIPSQEPPEKISLKLYIAAGSIMEKDKEQGLAHFLEHLVFRGSRNFPEGTVQHLQKLGSALGPHINACTSFFETIYQLDVPENDPHTLHTALLAMHDYAFGASLSEAIVNSERKVVLAEEKACDTVSYRARKSFVAFLTEGSSLSQRLPIGKVDCLKAMTAKDIQHFYKQWYQPQRMVLVLSGDISPEEASSHIQDIFGSCPRGHNRSSAEAGQLSSRPRAVCVHKDLELTHTQLILAVVKPHVFKPYDAEAFKNDLYETLLNDSLQTRLQKVQKQADSAFSVLDVSSSIIENCSKVSMLWANVPSGQWSQALGVLQQELNGFVSHGMTLSELEQSKKRILRQLEEAIKAEKTYSGEDWCSALIRAIAANQPLISAQLSLELAQEALSTFTLDTALAFLKTMWHTGDSLLFISTPEAISEKAALECYEKALQAQARHKDDETPKHFQYTAYDKPGSIKHKKHIKDLDIHSLHFANNVNAKLKVTDFEAETVYINVRFGGGGLDEPKKQRGLVLLADLAFLQGGLKQHSADDINAILSGKLIDISFEAAQDAFYLRAKCSKQDVGEALMLMLAYMTEPGYREESLREAHKNIEALYKYAAQTPEGVFANRGSQFLASGDERFALPDYDKWMQLSLKDLQTWLDKPLKKSALELSIVGDFDLDTVTQSLSYTFGALPSRDKTKPAYAAERKVSFPHSSKRAELPFSSDLDRSLVSVTWPTTDAKKVKKTRRLAVLAEVFRNKMLASLRESQGLSYSPSAKSKPSLIFQDYGYFVAGTVADTKHTQSLAQSILKIAEDLGTEELSEEEFERSMQPILKNLKNDLRDNNYWLHTVLSGSQERPVQLDWARNRAEDLASIQAQDIQALAKKYLHPNKALQLFVIPRKSLETSAP